MAPFLLQNTQGWQPSVVISGRMLSLAYSSETGWPHQRAVRRSTNWRDERLPKTDAHGCSCYHGLLMALGTDTTKIWSLCEVFECEPGTVPFSIDVHISCSRGQETVK